MNQQRRQFLLPEDDHAFLERSGFAWETVVDGANVRRVVIYEYPIPDGYNTQRAALWLRLEAAYPDAQIDMVYFQPHLALTSGKAINALSAVDFDGSSWQQWSRHRSPANPWVPGVDNIERQLLLVDEWLQREVPK